MAARLTLLLYDFAHLAHKPQDKFSCDMANQSDDLRFRWAKNGAMPSMVVDKQNPM
jgi:hypothetical protein